jgi:hypothetical protein
MLNIIRRSIVSPHNPKRFIFRIDHLTEEQINFFGWYEVAREGPVAVYRRLYDGEEQYVHDGPPKMFCTDDYNDALSMSAGTIIFGPENGNSD